MAMLFFLPFVDPPRQVQIGGSKSFFAGLAQLNLSYPFRLEDLGGIDAARWVWIKNGVDHVAATGLKSTCGVSLMSCIA